MNNRSLLVALFALLERERVVSIPQISQLLDADEDDIWALLEELVFAYDAVELRLELGTAHASLQRRDTTRILRLTETETAILLDALEAQGIGREHELTRKLVETKGFLTRAGKAPESRLHVVATPAPDALVQLLSQACEDEGRHLLDIEYRKDGSPRDERREVEPYALATQDGHLYLRAYDRTRGGWRRFRVDRIKHAEALDGTFEPRPLPQDDPAGRRATVRFERGALPADWPGLRKVRELDDGGTEATVPWYGGLWLPKKIAGMFGAATPTAPPELREATARYAAGLLGNTARDGALNQHV